MEVFRSPSHYIIVNDDSALWWSRTDGSPKITNVSLAQNALSDNAVCLGLAEGVIGKIQLHSESDRFLLLVRQKTLVGRILPGHQVFTVSKVVAIPLSEEEPQDLEFEVCTEHNDTRNRPTGMYLPKIQTTKRREERQKEKPTRRLLEELLKIFTDTNSFYFSSSYDLTSSLQRQCTLGKQNLPLLQQVDDRFFWNKYMMKDVIELQDPRVNDWVTPIIQGFVAIELIMLSDAAGWDERSRVPELFLQGECSDSFLIVLISRRSRHRAGMRYKCRGVDSKGHASIYVETEQIVYCRGHTAALVLVRGSLPVIWSQPGYRYNPLPVLNKNETETQAAFKAHFDDQLKNYNKQVIINLVKQGGPEKIVGDAFLRHVLLYNSADLTYVSFDFHEHCHGMKFENVKLLTEGIAHIINDMKWFWMAQGKVISRQLGTVRVNCIDCLDRTNVVQAAIAYGILENQLKAFEALSQGSSLPYSSKRAIQVMWADNGDAISRRYAGTNAMKGDLIRTGERNIAGVLKDGFTSANRYYLNCFLDSYRQAVTDAMQGIPVKDDLHTVYFKEESTTAFIKSQTQLPRCEVDAIIQHYREILIPSSEHFLDGWHLKVHDPSLKCATVKDLDVLLMLTNRACHLAYCDEDAVTVVQHQSILLEDLEKIELGPEPNEKKTIMSCLRLHYCFKGKSGYFHTLTQETQEDSKESLHHIAERLQHAKREAVGKELPITTQCLDRKNSALHDIPTVQLSEKDLEKAQRLYHNLLEDICSPENLEETQMGKSPHGAFELNEKFKCYDREVLSDSDDDLCASSHLYSKSHLTDLGGSYRSAASSSFIPCALPKAKSCKSHFNIQISEGNEDQLKTLVVLPFADYSELASSTSREALAPGTRETVEPGRLLLHAASVASASEPGAEAVLNEAEINKMVKNCKTRIIQI
ncbi:phosphatidylinositide phosphatase SAC2-like [Acipenser oxyrinchus oxyrinchus]|uniref:Phosphatidylinositide phosphatase SAC2-like n=1 Tax=Acipenser oxyrinchus oxyrinchus TaxID=40147 RepID=A0AAD8FWF7_ACIOX|nr:phosphatidylinositide phosphatase SAC2-like [Acipenser oxyrinchus oxyrinchus]